jgi:hypothetical protein
MTPDYKIAAREFINTQRYLLRSFDGMSVDAQAGYLAACAMACGPDILSSLTVKGAVSVFVEVLSE